jgi:hypothetical protein
MSVMLQAFYWDCPAKEKQDHNWWNFVADHVEDLSKSGFDALWLPPISKAAQTRSMGYDPYDYFDLGDYDQKGGKKTWYGNRAELDTLIKKAHDNRMGMLCGYGYKPQLRRGRRRIESTRRAEALDQVLSEKRPLPSRLELLPSQPV